MPEDDVLAFVRTSIKSVWALELLLLLRRGRQRAWPAAELVRELRSSDAAVSEAAAGLRRAGFVAVNAGGMHRYQPASPALDDTAREIEALYAEKPTAVVKSITSAPNDKLRIFADAFKLKDR